MTMTAADAIRIADLRGADLRYADLGGADLRYANLGGAVGALTALVGLCRDHIARHPDTVAELAVRWPEAAVQA